MLNVLSISQLTEEDIFSLNWRYLYQLYEKTMLRRLLRPRNEHYGDNGCSTCRACLNSQCTEPDGMLRSYEQASFKCNFGALLLRNLQPFVVATRSRVDNAFYVLRETPGGHLTFEINWPTKTSRREFSTIHIFTDHGK